jgi:hypothetical protein
MNSSIQTYKMQNKYKIVKIEQNKNGSLNVIDALNWPPGRAGAYHSIINQFKNKKTHS